MEKEQGITLIALIITIIITVTLVTIVIKFGTNEINEAKIEDLKATMLLIKGRAQIAIDKDSFGEQYDKTGMLNYEEATEYTQNIPDGLAEILTDTTNLYIWEQTAMDNNAIKVEISSEDFFIIDYSTLEIYYSQGYTIDETTYYSLSQLNQL